MDNPGVPPWIVVNLEMNDCLVSWPGRLLEVEALAPETEQEAELEAAANAEHHGRYDRVTRVRILREVGTGGLFGPSGDAVVEVINRAAGLTPEGAQALANHLSPDADAAYSRVWRRWDEETASGDPNVPVDTNRSAGSPINWGLSVISDLVTRAAASNGAARYITEGDPDDDPPHEDDVWLVCDAPWDKACDALLGAALALGAPELSGSDADVLLVPWRSTGF